MVGGREREKQRGKEKRSRHVHVHTHHFLFEGDRTVCRLTSSSCTTIGRDRRENKLMYCTKEKNK